MAKNTDRDTEKIRREREKAHIVSFPPGNGFYWFRVLLLSAFLIGKKYGWACILHQQYQLIINIQKETKYCIETVITQLFQQGPPLQCLLVIILDAMTDES